MPRYQVGEHVSSWNSGLAYIVKDVSASDLTGETFTYSVRRLKGGREFGPVRKIGESGLVPITGEKQ